ncbi:MAG: protein kinase [Gammaproteobacteria bacterium]|nr:protein kinase [Gammaproteobacteria bacterium]
MTDTEQAHTLKSGSTLDSYQIQQVLGVGGFGITYKAHDLNLDCLVAIKEYFPSQLAARATDGQHIRPRSTADQAAYEFGLQRFMDEARLLAKFSDMNIVRVRRFFEGNGTAYIIMDYEEGLPLSRYLMRCKTLSEDEVNMVFQPILSGLRAVHATNFLHRDIKPPNIYLRTGGTPVLLDFGAARQAVNNKGREVTNLGTHFYAPYEQFTTTEQQGPWTDIYGLGATLYHCLTGRVPPSSLDRMSAAHANRQDPMIPAVHACKGRYSEDLLACADWMLQLRAENRPQSTEELIDIFANTGGSQVTATIISKNDVDWSAELIRQAEQHLAKYVGPLAGMLVKQTMSKVHTVEQLYHALARHIDNTIARDQFLKEVNVDASITSTLNRRNHATTAPLAAPNSGPKTAVMPRQIDPALSEKLVQQLAYHIGPMSRLLVRQVVEANYDLEQIIDILSRELPSEMERERFRKAFNL